MTGRCDEQNERFAVVEIYAVHGARVRRFDADRLGPGRRAAEYLQVHVGPDFATPIHLALGPTCETRDDR